MEIITCTSSCEKEQHRTDKNAAPTNELVAYISARVPLGADALVDTVQRWLSLAATEAVAAYKLSSAATALTAVTTLAETAVKAATDAAAAAADHAPRMDYSPEEAAWQLSRGSHAIQYELAEGILIRAHKGASHRIWHAELQRQVLRDDGRDGQKRGKSKPPSSERPAGSAGFKCTCSRNTIIQKYPS